VDSFLIKYFKFFYYNNKGTIIMASLFTIFSTSRNPTSATKSTKTNSTLAVPEEEGGSGRTSAASSLGKKAGKTTL
jgi:hypothetical protein